MSVAYFLAKRIHFSKGDEQQKVSPPAIRIATAGIAIGLAVMLLSVAIVVGFKEEIRDKVSAFGGHLQVLAATSNKTFEKYPICISDSLVKSVTEVPYVAKAKTFITKPAVIKTNDDFLSVVMKSEDLGERELSVSETIARKLNLQIGDKVQVFFVANNQIENNLNYGGTDASVKARTLTIVSLYQTHFNQYDDQIILGSHELLRQVSGWDEDMASGLEIQLKDISQMEDVYAELCERICLTQDRRGTQLAIQTLRQQDPQLFGWLDLLDTNVWVILILMVIVSTFSMISGLMIIILEKAQMIGLLKALGCNNRQLRHTFLYIALFLTLKGLLWGNIVGLGICAVQSLWHPIALDPENYYLEWVPIAIRWWQIVLLNAGALCITMLMLIIPSTLVSKVSPGSILAND